MVRGVRIFKRKRRVGERDTMLLEIRSRLGLIPLVHPRSLEPIVRGRIAHTLEPSPPARRCQGPRRLALD